MSVPHKFINDPATLYVEYCRSCDTHSWCTHHDELKYHETFLKFSEEISKRFTAIEVIGNMIPSNLIPFKIAENKYIDSTTNKYVVYPQIGSFQIYFHNQVLFSKKQSNTWPNMNNICNKIQSLMDSHSKSAQNKTSKQLNQSSIKSQQPLLQDQTTVKQKYQTKNLSNSNLEDSFQKNNYYKNQNKGFTLTDHFKMYRPKQTAQEKDWLTQKNDSESSSKNIPLYPRQSSEKSSQSFSAKKLKDYSGETKLRDMLNNKKMQVKDQGKRQMIIKLDSIQEETFNEEGLGQTHNQEVKQIKKNNRLQQFDNELSSLQSKFERFQNRVLKIRNKQFQGKLDSTINSQLFKTMTTDPSKKEQERGKNRQRDSTMCNEKMQKVEHYLNATQEEKNMKLQKIYGEWKLVKHNDKKSKVKRASKQKRQQSDQQSSDQQQSNNSSQKTSQPSSSAANLLIFKPKKQQPINKSNVIHNIQSTKYSTIEKCSSNKTMVRDEKRQEKRYTEQTFYDHKANKHKRQSAIKTDVDNANKCRTIKHHQGHLPEQEISQFSQQAKDNINFISTRISNIESQLSKHIQNGKPSLKEPYNQQETHQPRQQFINHQLRNKESLKLFISNKQDPIVRVKKLKEIDIYQSQTALGSKGLKRNLRKAKEGRYYEQNDKGVDKSVSIAKQKIFVSQNHNQKLPFLMYEESQASPNSKNNQNASKYSQFFPKSSNSASKNMRGSSYVQEQGYSIKQDTKQNARNGSQPPRGQLSKFRSPPNHKLKVWKQSSPTTNVLQARNIRNQLEEELEGNNRALESHETAVRPKKLKKRNAKQNAATPKKVMKKGQLQNTPTDFKFEPGSIKFGQIKKNNSTLRPQDNENEISQAAEQFQREEQRSQNQQYASESQEQQQFDEEQRQNQLEDQSNASFKNELQQSDYASAAYLQRNNSNLSEEGQFVENRQKEKKSSEINWQNKQNQAIGDKSEKIDNKLQKSQQDGSLHTQKNNQPTITNNQVLANSNIDDGGMNEKLTNQKESFIMKRQQGKGGSDELNDKGQMLNKDQLQSQLRSQKNQQNGENIVYHSTQYHQQQTQPHQQCQEHQQKEPQQPQHQRSQENQQQHNQEQSQLYQQQFQQLELQQIQQLQQQQQPQQLQPFQQTQQKHQYPQQQEQKQEIKDIQLLCAQIYSQYLVQKMPMLAEVEQNKNDPSYNHLQNEQLDVNNFKFQSFEGKPEEKVADSIQNSTHKKEQSQIVIPNNTHIVGKQAMSNQKEHNGQRSFQHAKQQPNGNLQAHNINNIAQPATIIQQRNNVYTQSKQRANQIQMGVQKQLTFQVSIQTDIDIHQQPISVAHNNYFESNQDNIEDQTYDKKTSQLKKQSPVARNNFLQDNTSTKGKRGLRKKEIERAQITQKIYNVDNVEEMVKFDKVIKGKDCFIHKQEGSTLEIQNIYPSGHLFASNGLEIPSITSKFKTLIKVIQILSDKNEWLITRLFEDPHCVLGSGCFGIWLCKNFKWQCFVVDNNLKVDEDGLPFYTYSTSNLYWINLLEKAVGIALGGYENIEKADCSKLFNLLTGCNALRMSVKQDPGKNGKLLQVMQECQKKNYIIHAQKCANKIRTDSLRQPVFYILSIRRGSEEEEPLIQLSQDGRESVWMKLSKFTQQFAKIDIFHLRINHNYTCIDLGVRNQGHLTVIELLFQEEGQGCITISYIQKSGSLRAFLYKEEKSKVLKLVGQAKEKQKNHLFFECNFTESRYYIFLQAEDKPARISFVGEGRPHLIRTQEIRQDGLNNDLAEYLPVKQNVEKREWVNSSLGTRTEKGFKRGSGVQMQLKENFIEYILKQNAKKLNL